MKKYKRKAARLLLVVFSAILLTSFSYSNDAFPEKTQEVVVIHSHEFSGEAPGNVSRSYVDETSIDSRVFNEFTFHNIQEFHSKLSHISFAQVNIRLEQLQVPDKIYKQTRRLLI